MPKVTQLGRAHVRTLTQVSGPKALYLAYFTVLLRVGLPVMPLYIFKLYNSTREN